MILAKKTTPPQPVRAYRLVNIRPDSFALLAQLRERTGYTSVDLLSMALEEFAKQLTVTP